jgi:DNA-binding response OmpR family regulator
VVQSQTAPAELVFGNVVIDPATFGVAVNGKPAELAFYEFALLHRLCQEPDRIVDYDKLCDAVWSSRGPKERRRLSVAVCRLRAKLAGAWPYTVETVRGRGYGFIAARPLRDQPSALGA